MNQELNIYQVGLEGQGIGFDPDKNIYFVRGALPGDKVEIAYEEKKKRYRDASLIRVLTPSPHRVTSPCQYFGRCGGCDWLDWEYSEQLKAKDSILTHVLERAALTPALRLPIMASPDPLHYRGRIQVRQESGKIGFYKRDSNDLVDIESCAVAHPRLNSELAKIRAEEFNGKRKIELTLNESGDVLRQEDSPHGQLGFTQINIQQNEKLRDLIAGMVMRAKSKNILELFCGDGNLTFEYLTRKPAIWEQVVGIDSSFASITAATDRTRELKVDDRVSFICSTVGDGVLPKLPPAFKDGYDTLIMDPPRQGVGNAIQSFLRKNLNQVIYVSCSPVSFSQDAKRIIDRGFVLETLRAIDMFPHTRHIELVASFSR